MLCEQYSKYLIFPEDFETKINEYLKELYSWNEHTNLTSDEIETFIQKHLCFSLNFSFFIKDFDVVFDFGSGNGVPGIPLAVMFKEKTFVLVENKKRKITFLEYITSHLKLDKVQVVDSSYQSCPPLTSNFCVIAKAFSDFKAMTKFFKKSFTLFLPLTDETKIPPYAKVISKTPDIMQTVNFYEIRVEVY